MPNEHTQRHGMKYLIVIESVGTGFSAFSPDLPGYRTTREEVERNVREAVEFQIVSRGDESGRKDAQCGDVP